MFSLTDLYDHFSAEDIVEAVDNYFNSDDIVYIIYNMLEENDMEIPEEIEEHYNLHCK